MPIVARKTVLPSHLIRLAAFERNAKPGEVIDDWLQMQRTEFSQIHRIRKWDGAVQMRFDRYLQDLT